ncbi:hypothetical protein BKA70DRAFT_1314160 [Coprinopsis sp. MPI-PUGE-AT-0042]|nr:hypothetical protein BKA70DRAFT_1314160 [Coprinopsis sp. MPI-PUGE-AT-0042]
MIFFDVTAFLLATYRTGKSIMKGRKSPVKIKGSANDIIFAQGILYMAPVFVLSISSLVMNYKIHVYFTRLLNAFKLPLSGLLTARFLLKLRKWEKKKNCNNEPRCSLALQFNTTDPQAECGTASHPDPPESVSQSFASILEELGGDIGPRDSLEDLGADNQHRDVEEDFDSPIELDELTGPMSKQIKGKWKTEPAEEGGDDQPARSLPGSARRKTFVDLEAGLSFAGPSQVADHQFSYRHPITRNPKEPCNFHLI